MSRADLNDPEAPLSMVANGSVPPLAGFLRQPQVLSLVPISKSTLWRRVRARTFPLPVKLSERITAWRADDIRAWIECQGTEACS